MRCRSLGDTIAVVVILGLVAGLLAPVIAQARRTYAEAKCQSNMRRFAEAMTLYLADHQGRYPTNRSVVGLTNMVKLSALAYNEHGDPYIFQYGVNWVEGVQHYVIDAARTTDQDWLSLFKCPNASALTGGSTTARVSYVLNYGLLEKPKSIVRSLDKLMMIRESDRFLESVCRPTGLPPSVAGAFLNGGEKNLHAGNGSHILFADGHVRHFAADYFPADTWYTASHCWDSATNQWYNYGPGSSGLVPEEMIKSIAITP